LLIRCAAQAASDGAAAEDGLAFIPDAPDHFQEAIAIYEKALAINPGRYVPNLLRCSRRASSRPGLLGRVMQISTIRSAMRFVS